MHSVIHGGDGSRTVKVHDRCALGLDALVGRKEEYDPRVVVGAHETVGCLRSS